MHPRPKIVLELTTADKALEISGWLALVLLWGLVALNYTSLPDTIPTHYNLAGEVDDYGSKSTILLLPVLGTFMFGLITVLNRYPHIFNYPVAITAENARKNYTIATTMLRYLKLAILVIFSIILYATVQTANGKLQGLGPWFIVLTLGLILLPMLFFIKKLLAR